jgi:hypothetical protein
MKSIIFSYIDSILSPSFNIAEALLQEIKTCIITTGKIKIKAIMLNGIKYFLPFHLYGIKDGSIPIIKALTT